MSRLAVFNSVSLDGYFTDAKGDMSWLHNTQPDAEWDAWVAGNAKGGGRLVFGRITYEMMAGYWPTPIAAKNTPTVAEHMNRLSKIVFSRTLDKASWNNTRLIKGDMAAEVRNLKKDSGNDMVILGSGNIIAQLAQEGLIDEYQIVVTPVVLGKGRTIFDGVTRSMPLKLTKSQAFANGNVFLVYEPTK